PEPLLRGERRRPSRRVVDAAGRPQDDAARLEESGCARDRRLLNGDELNMTTTNGEELEDESFLVLFNAHHEPLTFRLPTRRFGACSRSAAACGFRTSSGCCS